MWCKKCEVTNSLTFVAQMVAMPDIWLYHNFTEWWLTKNTSCTILPCHLFSHAPCTATVAILEDSINSKLPVVTVVHMTAVMLRDTIRDTMCDMPMNCMLQVVCTS